MLEDIVNMLSVTTGPTHPTVGEAHILHETVAAFYYLRVKAQVYIAHCQSEPLKGWLQDASKLIDRQIHDTEALMKKAGISLPATLPETTDLSDQFIAMDAAAMVVGMLQTFTMGLQSSRHPDVLVLYQGLLDDALVYGAKLAPIAAREGWAVPPLEYQVQPHLR